MTVPVAMISSLYPEPGSVPDNACIRRADGTLAENFQPVNKDDIFTLPGKSMLQVITSKDYLIIVVGEMEWKYTRHPLTSNRSKIEDIDVSNPGVYIILVPGTFKFYQEAKNLGHMDPYFRQLRNNLYKIFELEKIAKHLEDIGDLEGEMKVRSEMLEIVHNTQMRSLAMHQEMKINEIQKKLGLR